MTERLIAKLERLGAEAGIKEMTPEIFQFALGVRADLAAEWPKRSWVGLTQEERKNFWYADQMSHEEWNELFDAIEAKLKEKNT